MEVEPHPQTEKEAANGAASRSKPSMIPTNAIPMSKTRIYRPYFTPVEVATLSQKQRGNLSEDGQEKARQAACTFMEAIGLRMGFPRKTIATGQTLYHRFRLFFPFKDFNYHDVSVAALYVSAKMHDTIKKPQDVLEIGYTVRYPELVNHAGIAELDGDRKSEDRRKLLAIERLVLETICFNFTIKMAFPYVIKFARDFKASKDLAKFAWRLCADSHRTVISLEYPPHAIALASLYLAGLLSTFETNATPSDELVKTQEFVDFLSQPGDWEAKYLVKVDDLEVICHTVLDLLVSQSGAAPQSYSTSPTTPSSPSPYPSPRTPNPFRPNSTSSMQASTEEAHIFNAPHLTRLKIALRKQEADLREKGYVFRNRTESKTPSKTSPAITNIKSESNVPSAATTDTMDTANGSIGKNEGTVRFLFGPSQE